MMSANSWSIRSYGKMLRRRSRIRLMFTSWRCFLTVIGLLAVGYFSVVAALMLHRFWQDYWLGDSRTVRGLVVERFLEENEITNTHHGKDYTQTYHYLEYAFQAPSGREYRRKVRVSPGLWNQAQPGGPIEVDYAVAKPWINRLVAHRDQPWLGSVIVASLGMGLGIGLLGMSWLRAGRDETLLINGRMVDGLVVQRLEEKDHLPLRLVVRYQPHCAAPCTIQEEVYAGDPLLGRQVEDVLPVIYDPARPTQARVIRPHLKRLIDQQG
ncbi:MAG: hypothetical protein ACLFUJ_04140 [Phycisphaerae bacterium]